MTGNLVLPLILQVVGAGVLIAEVVFPSGGLLAILTMGILGYSLYLVFSTVSMVAGMAFVLADIIILPIVVIAGFKVLGRSKMALHTELSSSDGFTSHDESLAGLVGQKGIAITDLRPAGTAMIGNRRVDVVTRGDYIEKGAGVLVDTVEGGRVVARGIEKQACKSTA
ncbi:MAG: serine protease [Deltaproteobacteria bacterium]|nr:serine protease [Deltaproteobacteria bacterium]